MSRSSEGCVDVMDVVTQQENEGGRVAVYERVHLLSADDTVTECHWYGTYIALCGSLVAADSLPESLHPDDCECDTERLFCPQCVRAAARCGADAGLVDPAVGAIQ